MLSQARGATTQIATLCRPRSGPNAALNYSPYVAAEVKKRKSVEEGESVTLETPVEKKPNDVMTWYFNETLIAEITGDQSKICTDDQCKERFGDRLKLDHQTGSLTITNTRNTDSGEYQLEITSSFSITSIKNFSVAVNSEDEEKLHERRGSQLDQCDDTTTLFQPKQTV
ncbi:hypothetical protein DPX16_1120 [Anabarilius grahami]|uniref:Ig-like domain-containing protein n=1 Tax=Anabarilius grahami TaxID=495550 RepID=A0A3N0YWH3_ANAGA|nr:hypothetical protein DPX16_1120 [Anabarilius grahami]